MNNGGGSRTEGTERLEGRNALVFHKSDTSISDSESCCQQITVAKSRLHVLHPGRVRSYFDHDPRHDQCLEELPYIFLRCPQLSFGQGFSLQTQNAVLTPAVSQIHSHRQTIEIGSNRVSPAIFLCARAHGRRVQ